MSNETITHFGYPDTLIREYTHWTVLLRRQQVTLGSLVLCAQSDSTAFAELPAGAFEELGSVVRDIERVLQAAFQYEKINYLMLMMVDPHVHFHVFPRYAAQRSACGITVADAGWPRAPKLEEARTLTPDECEALRDYVAGYW